MIQEGSAASILLTVTSIDTAIALGSGDVAVLATPRVVALCEEAAVAALAGQLADDSTSVGTNINLDHLTATPVGRTVTAIATVTAVEGKRISFDLRVEDSDTIAASGTHTRYIVNRTRFEESF